MTSELKILAWCVLLGLVHVLIAAALGTSQRGLQWNVGNRDAEPEPLRGVAGRAFRASSNFLETFPFFAAAVLALTLVKGSSPHTALGAQVYFWSRLAYLPIYIIGIPYVRTLAWAVALWGLLQVLFALF
ncbi:MAG: MAPEG family protein [Steroidobacteraceae bacterium]